MKCQEAALRQRLELAENGSPTVLPDAATRTAVQPRSACCCDAASFGVCCAARRLNAGRFVWPRDMAPGAAPMTLTQLQFDALVLGLPWQRLEHMRVISRM